MHCVMHVGMPKTGTTSIQRFIKANRDILFNRKVFVPSTRNVNMREFAMANDALGFFRPAKLLRRPSGLAGATHDNYFEKIADAKALLDQQMADAKAKGFESVLITSENLSYLAQPARKDSVDAIDMVKQWLSAYCDTFTIIIAIRRQDLWSISKYKNVVKSDANSERPNCILPSPMMDYDASLKLWEAVFGRDAIKPIIFPDSSLTRQGIIKSFCDAADLSDLYRPELETEFWENTSTDGRAIETMRMIAVAGFETFDAPIKLTQLRREAEQLLENEIFDKPIQKIMPARAEAEALVNRYATSNESVRARYFPDSPSLFQSDFSKFPDVAHYPRPGEDDLLRLLVKLMSSTRAEFLMTKGSGKKTDFAKKDAPK